MDIYSVIQRDHDEVKETMARIQQLPLDRHSEKLRLFGAFRDELIAHNESEDASFYIALEQHEKTKKNAELFEKEHRDTFVLLDELDDRNIPPAIWSHKFGKLVDALIHHITQEESQIFAEAHRVFSDDTAARLGTIMQDLKNQRLLMLKKAA